MSAENKPQILTGYTRADEFRVSNQYTNTEQLFAEQGLTRKVENNTPPVCVNIAHLATTESIQALGKEFSGQALSVAILGISSARGPKDLQDLLKSLGAEHISTTAIDISDGIFNQIQTTGLDEVHCWIRDAQNTGLPEASQDIVLRDHLGNCCPPEVDKTINLEVARILKPNAISIVNITTYICYFTIAFSVFFICNANLKRYNSSVCCYIQKKPGHKTEPFSVFFLLFL